MQASRSNSKGLSLNVGTRPKEEKGVYCSKRDESLRRNFIATGKKSEAYKKPIAKF